MMQIGDQESSASKSMSKAVIPCWTPWPTGILTYAATGITIRIMPSYTCENMPADTVTADRDALSIRLRPEKFRVFVRC